MTRGIGTRRDSRLYVACAVLALSATATLPTPADAVAAKPATGAQQPGQLVATLSLSPHDVWSVGGTGQPGQTHGHTLIDHWDGTRWARVPSPDYPGVDVSSLNSISGTAGSDVWASGGGASDNGDVFDLMLHWNGKKWSRVDVPDHAGSTVNYLQAVSAHAWNNAWAAADYVDPQGVWIPYAEHWDGRSWKVVEVATPPGAMQTFLTGVFAAASDDVWLVGQCIDSSGVPVTFAERWNGRKWAVVQTPNPRGVQASGFSAIAGSRADNLWAVGNTATTSGSTRTLVEHWDGSTWAVVKSPNPRAGLGSTLASVTAAAPDDVWSVGESQLKSGRERTLIEHWDGATWSVVPSPNVAGQESFLDGVSATSRRNAWATGSSQTQEGASHALNLRWDGSGWSISRWS